MKALFLVFRIILGVLITGAGIGKALDISGFIKVIGTYKFYLPAPLTLSIAVFVIIFEIFLGLWILFGKNLKIPAILSIIMHAGYFILISTSLLRGLELQNCGCFGVFLARPLMWYTPLEDLALILISYYLYYHQKSHPLPA